MNEQVIDGSWFVLLEPKQIIYNVIIHILSLNTNENLKMFQAIA